MGVLIGFLGYGLDSPYHTIMKSLQLGMYLAAVMLLLPKMTSIMMEGLLPLSEATKEMLVKRLPDRNITIGMDTALIVGDSSVTAPALLMIPTIVLTAIFLPGNIVMPLGDLSQFAFMIACMVPVFRGNIIRTWITSAFCFGSGLWIASWMAEATTEVFMNFGSGGSEGLLYSSINPSANPFTGLFATASNAGIPAYLLITAILVTTAVLLKKKRLNTIQGGKNN